MTGRARAVPVRLTIKRRRKLEQIIAAGTSRQRLVLRAKIVLAAATWAAAWRSCGPGAAGSNPDFLTSVSPLGA